MSILETNELGQMLVIGRAFGDEPVKLLAISDWGSAFEVRREEDRDSIGFRKETIYRYDPELFEKLCAAFRVKDRKTVMRLWNDAKHCT
jgi:hypothetical protein